MKHEDLIPKFEREARCLIADLKNPARYIIYCNFGYSRYFLNVSDHTFCYNIDMATLFKRKYLAMAVAKACSDAEKYTLLVAKVTTKNGEGKVLKYEMSRFQPTV